jgi:hypothetical protein
MLISQSHNNSNFNISIKRNTNKVISSSEDSFGGFGIGSYIQLGNKDTLFPILKTNRFFYFKDFEVNNSKEILIKEDIGINLQLNDNLDIIIDEYELVAIESIKETGRQYLVNEILTVVGGETSLDINNGQIRPTKFKVEEVGLMGEILKLSCVDYGNYVAAPPKQCKLIGSKSGDASLLELKYNTINNKKVLKRVIKEIRIENNKSFLKLDYSIPPGTKVGKFSTEKWEMELGNIYLEETLIGVSYKIIKDFTPNIRIPLMAKNSFSPDSVYNKGVQLIDSEISKLRNEIDELKKLIKHGS